MKSAEFRKKQRIPSQIKTARENQEKTKNKYQNVKAEKAVVAPTFTDLEMRGENACDVFVRVGGVHHLDFVIVLVGGCQCR